MRRLLILVLLGALLVFADIAVRTYAEDEIERRAEARAGGSADVQASVDSFPFVPRLLSAGFVGDVDVRITGFTDGRLRIATARVELHDLRIDQERLRQDREVHGRAVERAVVTVEVRGQDLAAATGLPVEVEGGEVRLSAQGRSIEVTPAFTREGSLELQGAPQVARVPVLERSGFTGCTSARAAVQGERLVLTCRTDDLPPLLVGGEGT